MTDSYTINVPESGQGDGWADWVPLNLSPDQMVTLDLSDLQVVGPTLAARLRALIDRHSAGGGSVEVIPPTRSAVRTYFAAMRLSADLPAECSCDLGPIPKTIPAKVLIPIRRLRNVAESDLLDDELGELLSAQFTGSIGRLAEAFAMTAGEMCDNATSHGHSSIVGAYVAAQRWNQHCILTIGDLGIGIPDHIRKVHPEFTADDDAIRLATREGYTGTGDEHRGVGYQCAIDCMKETKVPFGELRVWSGMGRFRVEVADGVQVRRRAWPVEEATAGTWVRVALSATGADP
jgi:hypothetical protein